MSKIKRAMTPELYQLIDEIRADLPNDTVEDEDSPEAQAERAENYRDSLREDGINV